MNILIIKPSSLGDIVHALPAVDLIRRHLPDAFLAWVVHDSLSGLLDLCPSVDEVILFQRDRWGRLRHWHELPSFVGELRHHRFDLALDFQGLFRSGLMAFASGAPRRIGFRHAREGAGFFYTERIPVPVNLRHAVDRNIFLARAALTIPAGECGPSLLRPPEAHRQARALLQRHGVEDGAPLVAVGPGARWPSKRWPASFFAAVLDGVAERLPEARFWILGSAAEARDAREVIENCRGCRPLNLAGKTDLGTLVDLVRCSRVLVTNDSGPMHIAAAVSVPTVAFFGATDPELTGPYGAGHAVFRSGCDRSPCFERMCPLDGRLCSDGVAVEQVIEAVASRVLSAMQMRHGTTVLSPEEETPR
ncbi:MAG: lipopolysaccharide heptosyltransferase II [Lentisphaeria bacterium]|nr:lipopolysaccharide heptosyltransferase II [Lentisphaeria bacterium]